jgi:hypothetical protein
MNYFNYFHITNDFTPMCEHSLIGNFLFVAKIKLVAIIA